LVSPALAAPRVVVSIKPLQSLVAMVMQDIAVPSAIVKGAGSPHTYAMTPSQAAELAGADLIVRVGHDLEAFLDKPIDALGGRARILELIEAEGLETLPLREGGPFEEHEHEAAGGGDAGDHGGEEGADPHIWLDPRNAKAILTAAAEALGAIDPANAAKYSANADRAAAQLDDLEGEIRAMLAPVQGRRFIVFHDAFQYFENRFDLPASGSITVNPENAPGAERLAQLRAKVRDLAVACVFAEPQFPPRLVDTVIEGTPARKGALDPDGGFGLAEGPQLYFTLLRNMAAAMRDCLAAS
jgi:zinc transport system substrate-binding protein